jgi:hypothetical protein
MTSTVSLNSNLYHEVERGAMQLGISMNKLYTLAVTEFLRSHCQAASANQYIRTKLAEAEQEASNPATRWLSEDEFWDDESEE